MLCVTMDAGIQTGYHNLFNIYYKEGNLLYILGLHAMTLQLLLGRSQFCVDQSMIKHREVNCKVRFTSHKVHFTLMDALCPAVHLTVFYSVCLPCIMKLCNFTRPVASSIIGGGAHIHIFVFADHKNNRFQKKLIVLNTNI